MNFAVSNTLGAYLTLTGIAILYAHGGVLNFVGVEQSLVNHPPADGSCLWHFYLSCAGSW